MQQQMRALVLGGGFAGVQAVGQLGRRVPGAAISLIDRNEYSTMIPALPDVLSGRLRRPAITARLAGVVGDRVALIHDEVSRVDLDSRELVGLKDRYPYDVLVLTGGSVPEYHGFSPDDGVLHTVHSFTAADRMRAAYLEHIRRVPRGNVVVVGGGYTGLEVAASLRLGFEQHRDEASITVVEAAPDVLTFLNDRQRAVILRYLDSIRVELRTGTTLKRYTGGDVGLSDGTTISDALVCWAAGMRAAVTGTHPGVARTGDGRITVDPCLQLPGYPEVFVAGDAAAIEKDGSVVRRAVNFAFYSGRMAGRNAAAFLTGGRLTPFRPVDLGWVIPLGGIGVGRVLGLMRVGGRLALRMHYAMCGFRHFRGADTGEFYRTAFKLSRSPDPLV